MAARIGADQGQHFAIFRSLSSSTVRAEWGTKPCWHFCGMSHTLSSAMPQGRTLWDRSEFQTKSRLKGILDRRFHRRVCCIPERSTCRNTCCSLPPPAKHIDDACRRLPTGFLTPADTCRVELCARWGAWCAWKCCSAWPTFCHRHLRPCFQFSIRAMGGQPRDAPKSQSPVRSVPVTSQCAGGYVRVCGWFPAIATAMLNTCRHPPKEFLTPADTCLGRCYAQVWIVGQKQTNSP